MNSDDFFDQGGSPPDVVAGRYRLPHPETGREESWTRATTHAELPEDSYAITRWQLRQLLLGLRARPDLLRLVESWADEPDRAALDAVITTAHEVAGNDAKANLGTAIHEVLRRVDRAWPVDDSGRPVAASDLIETTGWLSGLDLPDWAAPHIGGYLTELARHGLRPLPAYTERRVVNLDLGCAGTIDNLYEEADGTVALGDKKTGRLDYPERKYAVQLAVYAGSAYLLDEAGGPPLDLRSVGLRQDYAVLVSVDPESGACSVYRVDLRRGQVGANLAAQVREWRRERHLLLPYVAPGALPAEQWRAAERSEGGRHLQAVPSSPLTGETRVVLDRVQQWTGTAWTDRGPAVASDPPAAPVQTEQIPIPDVLQGQNVHPDQPNMAAVKNGPALRTAEDLSRSSVKKAEVQAYCRAHGITDLAHNKPVLVKMLEAAGKLAPNGAGRAQAGAVPKDPAELPAGPIGNGEDPTDPRSQAFHRARLAEVQAAASVADLGRIHAYVTRVGGDQAWTDELTEAARARAAYLDGKRDRVIEWNGAQLTPAQAVARAESSQQMAQVWDLTTLGGSDEAAWTAELNEQAHGRLAALQAYAEQLSKSAPDTPFGKTD